MQHIDYRHVKPMLFFDRKNIKNSSRTKEDFFSYFRFPSEEVALRPKGMCALACAALCGDVSLVRQLVAMKAAVNSKLPPLVEVDVLPATWLLFALVMPKNAPNLSHSKSEKYVSCFFYANFGGRLVPRKQNNRIQNSSKFHGSCSTL